MEVGRLRYLSTFWYDSSVSKWKTNFTPTSSAILGDYDIRIMVNDTDGASTGWTTCSDVIIVTNNVPSLSNYSVSTSSVLRSNAIVIGMNTTDTEDGESSHTVVVQYRATSGGWQTSYLSTVWYDSSDSRWETNFTVPTTAPLGTYDVRIMVNDTDSGSTGWSTYNDIITVTNNVPVIESYAISADEVNRTDMLSMTIEVSDTENADNLLSIQVQYKSPAGNWSSTSLSTAWYDSSAEKWKLNFTASDTAELGDYDVRVKVTDSDDTASSWSTYNDNFEVKMAPEWSYSTGSDVLAVAFSSDGEYMVTGSKDNKVYLFSKDSSTPLWSYTTGNDVYSVAISGNGEYIAAGSDDNKIYFFDKDSSTPEWSSNLGDDVRACSSLRRWGNNCCWRLQC